MINETLQIGKNTTTTQINYNDFIKLFSKMKHIHQTVSGSFNEDDSTTNLYDVIVPLLRSRILDNGLTLKKSFQLYDKNNSGAIEKEELKDLLDRYGITDYTKDEFNNMFSAFDTNKDNKIQYNEFVKVISSSNVTNNVVV
jgi:Ca2+-binding EF-hand superfamily protein